MRPRVGRTSGGSRADSYPSSGEWAPSRQGATHPGEDGEDGEDGDGGSEGEDGEQGGETDADDGADDGESEGEDDPNASFTTAFGDCDDGDCADGAADDDDPSLASPPVADFPSATAPSEATAWSPKNDRAPPLPVSQADLTLDCHEMGSGVAPGYVRFGCKALDREGQHYGIVKGWWRVVRRDGVRSKAKNLNFREGGYDMTFDVPAPDAAGGIRVEPGAGEVAPPLPNG